MSSSRPEHQFPPEIYYNESEAKKYTSNSRIIEVQSSMSERALELLSLPENESCFLLDLGCGSALSSSCLEDNGHHWVGIDISIAMLNVALKRDLNKGDLIQGDLGQGLPFRPGTFDGAISVSALQWLCNSDKVTHNPIKRLLTLFTNLYACLKRGSRAVFQFYPENRQQTELIIQQSKKAGFTGGLVIDFPNSTKAKKLFLVLLAGSSNLQLPKPLTDESEAQNQVSNINIKKTRKDIRKKPLKKSKDWILQKKERRRRQGKEVCADTKYTGRKRSGRF